MDKRIHILRIRTNLVYNDGVTSFVRNYYRNINKSRFKIDFIVHQKPEKAISDEIKSDGNRVFEFPSLSLKNVPLLMKKAYKLMKTRHYDIVHLNLPNAAFIYLKQAKRAGVGVRIMHCHETKFSDIKSHAVRNRFLWMLGKQYVTTNFACSDLAGKFLYKKKKYIEINNAIDSSSYLFDPDARKRIRDELHIPSDVHLFGMVGRYCPQKNQLFAIQLFQKQNGNNVLICLGSKNDSYYKECAETSDKDKNIILLNSTKNVSDYYSAFDALVLPSQYEGLPLTLVEAQANGLPCFASSTITREADLGGVYFLPLDLESWKAKIDDFAPTRNMFTSAKFDVKSQAKRLESLYFEEVTKLGDSSVK